VKIWTFTICNWSDTNLNRNGMSKNAKLAFKATFFG